MNSLFPFFSELSFPLLAWLLPLSWLLHACEEIVMIDRWERGREVEHTVIADRSILARWTLNLHALSRGPFTIAVAVVGILVVGATFAGTVNPHGIGGNLYTMALGGYFLHGFLHVGQSIVLRGYTPGILTAMFLVLPSSWYLYERLFDAGLLDVRTAVLTAFAGTLVLVPVVVGTRMLLRSTSSSS